MPQNPVDVQDQKSSGELLAEQTKIRRGLLARGYVPLANVSKVCVLSDWPRLDVDEAMIEEWSGQRRYLATGVRIEGQMLALDMDIDDAGVLDAIWRQLPGELKDRLDAAPCRFGKGEKFALFLRLAAGEKKVGRQISQGYAPPDRPDKLMRAEAFDSAKPRQLGCYGPHSFDDDDGSVAVWYDWADGDGLVDVDVADLPEVTRAEVELILDTASEVMNAAGWDYEVKTFGGVVSDRPVFDIDTEGVVFETAMHGDLSFEELEAVCGEYEAEGVRLSASWLEGPSAVTRSRCIARLNPADGRLQIWETAAQVLHRPVWLDMNAKISGIGERLRSAVSISAGADDDDAGLAVEQPEKSRLDLLLEAVPEDARFFGGASVDEGGRGEEETEVDAFDLAHDALALGLGATSFDDNARYVSAWGKWLLWDGLRWEVDERRAHMTLTREYLRGRAKEIVEWAEERAEEGLEDETMTEKETEKLRAWAKKESRGLRSSTTIAAVATLAQSNEASVASGDDFDVDTMLIGTPEGVIDLTTGAVRAAGREDMITKLTGYAPKRGTPYRWLAFLNEIFAGDQEVIDFMQRAAGYALTGKTTEHKMLFLYGGGRNGKGVFLNTLTALWGDYVEKASAESFLTSSSVQHPTNIAKLKGARLVVGAELPKGKVWDENVIKDLTGGDTMTARFMRQDFFDFIPQLTLMIAGNNQPSFRGVDEAIRARVVMVPFTVTIPPEKRDADLKDKLLAEEGQEIMQWVVDGALAWQKRGLDVPQSIKEASQAYFDNEDIIGQFMEDTMVEDPHGFETTSDLYTRFKSWCESSGLSVWTMHTFRKDLIDRGVTPHRTNQGKGFKGWWLKSRRLAALQAADSEKKAGPAE